MDFNAAYQATITAEPEEPEKLLKLLQMEAKEGEHDRASFHPEISGNKVSIKVHAADSVALRATLVSITKILTIFEKTSQLE